MIENPRGVPSMHLSSPAREAWQDPIVYQRRWQILAMLGLSLVIVVVGNTVLNVALPTLVRELNASGSELQWIVDAYALSFAGFLLPFGGLGDRYGRKGVLQLGLITFGLASLLSGIATASFHLIVTRAVMGAAAAAVMPATLSLLTNVFPPEERARAIGIWVSLAGGGGVIGPMLSGFLLKYFSWSTVFFVNVPIVVVALVGGALLIPTSRDSEQRRFDLFGAFLLFVGFASLLFAFIEGPEHAWTGTFSLVAFGVSGMGFAAYVWWHRRVEHSLLDLELFRDRRMSLGCLTLMVAFFGLFGFNFLLTQYLQFVQGYSPLEAGLSMLPMVIMVIAVSPQSSTIEKRLGRRWTISLGLALFTIGAIMMATLYVGFAYLHLAMALVVIGVGVGLVMAPATAAIMASVPPGSSGVGSAINDLTREVGGGLGIAVLGSALSIGYRSSISDVVNELPVSTAEAARDSLGFTLSVARDIGSVQGAKLAQAATSAFGEAHSFAMLVAASVALIGSVLVLRYMPVEP